MKYFDQATVISLLEYMYAGKINDPETIETIRTASGPNTYIFKRSFDQNKLTVELLKMAVVYQVEDLKSDCIEHLKKTMCDDNVMRILTESHAMRENVLFQTYSSRQ